MKQGYVRQSSQDYVHRKAVRHSSADVAFDNSATTTGPTRTNQFNGIQQLMAFSKKRSEDIAEFLGLGRRQAGVWRRRWQQSFDALVAIEGCETHVEP